MLNTAENILLETIDHSVSLANPYIIALYVAYIQLQLYY